MASQLQTVSKTIENISTLLKSTIRNNHKVFEKFEYKTEDASEQVTKNNYNR